MGRPQLKVYFDIVSPFSYEAVWIIRNSKAFSQCDIHLVPALLGAVMKACNNTAPLNIKNKDKWIEKDRLRHAAAFSIPLASSMPAGFPVRTVSVMRHLCALSALSPELVGPCAIALWQHFFVDRRPVEKAEDFAPVLEKVLGKERAAEVAASAETKGKEVLAKNTELALKDEAFGFPWMLATDGKGVTEGYWGVNSLGQVLAHLGWEKPSGEAGWRSVL